MFNVTNKKSCILRLVAAFFACLAFVMLFLPGVKENTLGTIAGLEVIGGHARITMVDGEKVLGYYDNVNGNMANIIGYVLSIVGCFFACISATAVLDDEATNDKISFIAVGLNVIAIILLAFEAKWFDAVNEGAASVLGVGPVLAIVFNAISGVTLILVFALRKLKVLE